MPVQCPISPNNPFKPNYHLLPRRAAALLYFLSAPSTSELFLERHENISILFADICNFTEMTTSLPVDKLVETLNDLFGKFDDAADVS